MSATGSWSLAVPGEVKIWNWETLEPAATFVAHKTGVSSLVFTPDSRMLVTGGTDGSISLWKLDSLEEKTPAVSLQGHATMVFSSAVSPNGDMLATGDLDSVLLWDLRRQSKVPIAEFPQNSTADALQFTPDGRTLVVGYGNGAIKLWNIETRREMITLEGHESFLQEITFSPAGAILASASADGTVRLWRGANP